VSGLEGDEKSLANEIGNIIGVGTPSNRVSSYWLDVATEESGI
jgi:hypothetical protein